MYFNGTFHSKLTIKFTDKWKFTVNLQEISNSEYLTAKRNDLKIPSNKI